MGSGSGITPRQAEIVQLIGAGLTDRQVAVRLGVSERTVGTHLERLFARLKVHSRAQALTWYHGDLQSDSRQIVGPTSPHTEHVDSGELKTHLSRYLDTVRKGAEVVVTEQGQPVVRLCPTSSRSKSLLPQEGLGMSAAVAVDDLQGPDSGESIQSRANSSRFMAIPAEGHRQPQISKTTSRPRVDRPKESSTAVGP